MGDLLVAQHAFAGVEGAEDVEAAGKRRDELAVLAARSLGQAVFKRALESRGSRYEMTDVAHRRLLLLVNGRLFLCGAEPAIASLVPQCARAGFDLRTCKAAMSLMRELSIISCTRAVLLSDSGIFGLFT
jgi:hypothetical protein